MTDEWGRAAETGGEFIQPRQLAGHLLIIYPIGYVPHIQTRFSQAGKQSDAVAVDVVDLDDKNEQGLPGRVYRNSNWMQGQIIASLRPSIGSKILATIGQGMSKSGMNPPWVIIDMFDDSTAKERASAWLAANPDFRPSPFVLRQPAPVAPVQQQQTYPQTPAPAPYQQPPAFSNFVQPQPQGYGQQQPNPIQQQPSQYPQQQYQQPGPSQPAPPQRFGVQGAAQLGQQEMTMLEQMRNLYHQQQAGNGDNPPF